MKAQSITFTDEKKKFIMLVGLPASGKSSYVGETFPEFVYLSTDAIIESIAGALKKTYSEVFDDVITDAQEIVNSQISLASYAKEDIIVDQTNLTIKSRARKLALLRNKDAYEKIAIVFKAPESILKLRLTKRASSGKIIPESAMNRMAAIYEEPTREEGFDSVVVISQ